MLKLDRINRLLLCHCILHRALTEDTLQIELEFEERGTLEYKEINLLELGREPTTNLTHMTMIPGIEPGAHWWEGSALTTAPSLLPIERMVGCLTETSFLGEKLRLLSTNYKPGTWHLFATTVVHQQFCFWCKCPLPCWLKLITQMKLKTSCL